MRTFISSVVPAPEYTTLWQEATKCMTWQHALLQWVWSPFILLQGKGSSTSHGHDCLNQKELRTLSEGNPPNHQKLVVSPLGNEIWQMYFQRFTLAERGSLGAASQVVLPSQLQGICTTASPSDTHVGNTLILLMSVPVDEHAPLWFLSVQQSRLSSIKLQNFSYIRYTVKTFQTCGICNDQLKGVISISFTEWGGKRGKKGEWGNYTRKNCAPKLKYVETLK